MIKFKLDEGVDLPEFGSEEASGFDVRAVKIIASYKGSLGAPEEKLEVMRNGFERAGYIKVRPFERILFGTGLTVADMASNIELQVRSRSGIALKRGLIVANQPGTVDSDYRSEIGIIIYNSSPILAKIELNERIAQIVPQEKTKVDILEIDTISETLRGEGGFGSSGTE